MSRVTGALPEQIAVGVLALCTNNPAIFELIEKSGVVGMSLDNLCEVAPFEKQIAALAQKINVIWDADPTTSGNLETHGGHFRGVSNVTQLDSHLKETIQKAAISLISEKAHSSRMADSGTTICGPLFFFIFQSENAVEPVDMLLAHLVVFGETVLGTDTLEIVSFAADMVPNLLFSFFADLHVTIVSWNRVVMPSSRIFTIVSRCPRCQRCSRRSNRSRSLLPFSSVCHDQKSNRCLKASTPK